MFTQNKALCQLNSVGLQFSNDTKNAGRMSFIALSKPEVQEKFCKNYSIY